MLRSWRGLGAVFMNFLRLRLARLRWRDAAHLGVSTGGVLAIVGLLHAVGHLNPTTAAVCLLVAILVTATVARLSVAVVCSFVAVLGLNFFFFPPLYTFRIAEPQNWTALAAFLVVSVVASQLSAAAQSRAREAVDRRNELGRLFDLSRDVLLTTDRADTLEVLAGQIARRFELARLAVCLPGSDGRWEVHNGGEAPLTLEASTLSLALTDAGSALAFDARARTYGGHTSARDASGGAIALVPLRLGTRAIGVLAAGRDSLDPGTLDAIAGLAAIAVERTQFLAERKAADLVRQRADLASTLLASISHDLRTPLTAASVAIANVQDETLPVEQRREQARLAAREMDRLERLFRDILDMARIDASALTLERDWVTAADVVDAAVANLRPSLGDRLLDIEADGSTSVTIDPRLTSAALSHLIENAAQYAPADRPIVIRGWVDAEGLHLTVRDHGPGLDPHELEQVFERFYRGRRMESPAAGTGMGLAITRGLLSAEGGRVWAEHAAGGGAQFSMVVPGSSRAVMSEG